MSPKYNCSNECLSIVALLSVPLRWRLIYLFGFATVNLHFPFTWKSLDGSFGNLLTSFRDGFMETLKPFTVNPSPCCVERADPITPTQKCHPRSSSDRRRRNRQQTRPKTDSVMLIRASFNPNTTRCSSKVEGQSSQETGKFQLFALTVWPS